MADRLDEAVARTKAALGDLLGDTQVEQEGRVEAERVRLAREAGGSLDRGPDDLERGIRDEGSAWGGSLDEPAGTGRSEPVEGDAKLAG